MSTLVLGVGESPEKGTPEPCIFGSETAPRNPKGDRQSFFAISRFDTPSLFLTGPIGISVGYRMTWGLGPPPVTDLRESFGG